MSNVDLLAEYEQGIRLSDIMDQNGDPAPGIVTTQDEFAISWSSSEAKDKIEQFLDTSSEQEARSIWRLCSQSQWNYSRAKTALTSGTWKSQLTRILYRPFDVRWTVFNPHIAVHRRERVMRHMQAGENIAISTTKTIEIGRGFEHVFCSSNITQHHSVSLKEVNYLFPLYLYPNPNQPELFDKQNNAVRGRRPNLSPSFIVDIERRLRIKFISDGRGDFQITIGPEDIFHYAYAIFHNPTYRSRYADFLKSDFPHLPLTNDTSLFAALAAKGAELVDLHLLRLPGDGGVGGNGGAAILSAPGKQGIAFPKAGNGIVESVSYRAPQGGQPGRVAINNEQYFEGIDSETWEMHIGGYQPLAKWLKDRKGRVLSFDDIQHYMRMSIALRETRRIMTEIDKLIPSWPLA